MRVVLSPTRLNALMSDLCINFISTHDPVAAKEPVVVFCGGLAAGAAITIIAFGLIAMFVRSEVYFTNY